MTLDTKHCPDCGQDLPLDAFARDRQTTSGLSTYCRACRKRRGAAARARLRATPQPVPQTKTCPQCGELLPATAFVRDRSRPNGLFRVCRACTRERYRTDPAWRARRAAYQRAWRQRVRERPE